jgi:hypothetical protein
VDQGQRFPCPGTNAAADQDHGSTWHEAHTIAVTDRAPERVHALLKAAVPVGTLVDPVTGPLADIGIISNGFIARLANLGAFDRLLSSMVRVPLAIRISTIALIGSTPAEAQAKPITRFSMSATGLARRKADCILVISDELANNLSPAAHTSSTAGIVRDGTSGGRERGSYLRGEVAAHDDSNVAALLEVRIEDSLAGRAPAPPGYLGESAILH